MAYGNIYYAEWATPKKQGYLYIDKLDYVGEASKLQLLGNGFYISTNTQECIIGANAEFEIFNDKINPFDLDPLLIAKEREYKIRIEVINPVTVSLFEGFLNCNLITQKYLHRQSIKFVASSYLSKLDDDFPTLVDTLQNVTFIDLIDQTLRGTGSSFPIYVNNTLKAEGDVKSSSQTCFNKNGIFTEMFWTDEAEKKTGFEILKTILISFNCKLYCENKIWYIERQQEIWGTSINYVSYNSEQTYTPVQSGTVVNITKTVSDLHSLVFTNQSQTRGVNPGLKTVKITLNDQRYNSLSKIDLANLIETNNAAHVPAVRTWEAFDNSVNINWLNPGKSVGSIKNAVQRSLSADALNKEEGLKTTFKITVVNENTVLEVSLKYHIDKVSYANIGKIEDLMFSFHWWLKVLEEDQYVEGPVEDPDSSIQSDAWTLATEGSNLDGLQYIENISGTGFNKVDNTLDLKISIPIGKVETFINDLPAGYLQGDRTLLFCLGTESVRYEDEYDVGDEQYVSWAAFGDIYITETGDDQPNIITGKIEENFVNKEDISLDVYDSESYSYRNAILRGDSLESRTERWGMLSGTNEIRERGVCYGLSTDPTIAGTKVVVGTGFGAFDARIGGLAEGTTYYARAYAIDGAGTVHYGASISFTTLEIVLGKYYEGGIVAYFLQPGDDGYEAGVKHGLIVSMYNLSEAVGIGDITGGGPYTSDANRYGLGDGPANTAGIQANTNQNVYGIRLITDYNTKEAGGRSDWFLPSWLELQKILFNKIIVGGFINHYYWTSSEPADGDLGLFSSEWKYAHAIDASKDSGSIQFIQRLNSDGYWKKTHKFAIRAVRSF